MNSVLSRRLTCGFCVLLAVGLLCLHCFAEASDPPGAKAETRGVPEGDIRVQSDMQPTTKPEPKDKQRIRPSKKKKANPVWLVFFFSKDCPRCGAVKLLIRGLKSTHAVRVKAFDIDREKDYLVYRNLEAIHGDGGFAVPMIIVGDSILIGEIEIERRLEEIVKRLQQTGGGRLPYLGPKNTEKKKSRTDRRAPCPCEETGRPPSLKKELGKLKTAIGKWLD